MKGGKLHMGTREVKRVVRFRWATAEDFGDRPETGVDRCHGSCVPKHNSYVVSFPYLKKILVWSVRSMSNHIDSSMLWIYETSCIRIRSLSLWNTWSILRLYVLIFFYLFNMCTKHDWHPTKKGLLMHGLIELLI